MLLVPGCLCAYLIGGVPFALVVVRLLKGIDVRTVGSGNVGATNASRAFTSRPGQLAAFLLIYLLDAGKGFVPAFWGRDVITTGDRLLTGTLLGGAAVLGHVFTPFLRFRGGKGVATATGVLLALDWQVTLCALAAFFVVRFLTGHVFLGSLALSLALAGAAVGLHPQDAFTARLPVTVLCMALALLLFWTHRSNLRKYLIQKGAARV